MEQSNNKYWYEQWHLDSELHNKLGIKNVQKIENVYNVSIYIDTDSLFVSFNPAMISVPGGYKNLLTKRDPNGNYSTDQPYLNSIQTDFIVLLGDKNLSQRPLIINNPHCLKICDNLTDFNASPSTKLIVDGFWIKNYEFNKLSLPNETEWNWSTELDFIHGIDHYRLADYFKQCLEDYAASYGVTNREDFELERISDSIINIAKKKYIQNIVYEDGVNHDNLSYIYPKGVELVRSSTPLFAREKIVGIVKYLFAHPDDFNIKDLLKLVRNLRKEFELADIDTISMQSSCSNYEIKILNDKDKLEFVSGTHFAVKASGYYNYLLNKNKFVIVKKRFQ